MSAPVETIRLSQVAKDQLVNKLKRSTKLKQWNVLCRWAFCASLAEPAVPPPADIPADSNVEMTWRVFAGSHTDIYDALLKQRCVKDGLGNSPEVLATQFRLHLHRGIGYLAGHPQLKSIADLVALLPFVDRE